MTEQEIIKGLASIGSAHPAWKALEAVLDDAKQQEENAVTVPALTDGARHFNAGRLACAKDIIEAVKGLKAEADKLPKE